MLQEARHRNWPIVHTIHEHRAGFLDAPRFVKEMFCPIDGIIAGTRDAETMSEVAPVSGRAGASKRAAGRKRK